MRLSIPAPPLTPGGPRLRDARRLLGLIGRWRPLRVSSDDAAGRPHAWQISGGWDEGQRRWELRMEPGYVSGAEVLGPSQPIVEVPEATLARLQQGGGDLPETARPWLSERPSFGITRWRAVGTDAVAIEGGAVEEIPEYFLERGVVPPDRISTANEELSQILTATPDELRTRRLLRAVDVVLNQPRAVARLEIDAAGLPAVGLSLPGDATPYVTIQAARYEAVAEAGSIQEEFARAIADEGLDRLLVGRLWLLSPAGLADGAEPDQRWTAYGQNEIFYNLDHDVNVDLDVIAPTPIDFGIPLAGGVAQLTIQGLTAEINANDALASAYLSTARVQGSWRSV